jgi:hypothetical protein
MQPRCIKAELPDPQTVLLQVVEKSRLCFRRTALVIDIIDQIPMLHPCSERALFHRRKSHLGSNTGGPALDLHDIHIAQCEAARHLEQRTALVAQAQRNARFLSDTVLQIASRCRSSTCYRRNGCNLQRIVDRSRDSIRDTISRSGNPPRQNDIASLLQRIKKMKMLSIG